MANIIKLTGACKIFYGKKLFINLDHVQCLIVDSATGNTIVNMTTDAGYLVKESPEEILKMINKYPKLEINSQT